MSETTADLSGRATPPPKAQSPWPRRILMVLVALFVLGGAIVVLAFTLTAGPVKAANAFFEATARQGAAASYALAAQPFRDSVPLASWDAMTTQSGLKGYAGSSWGSREVQNDTATLNGSLKVGGGGVLPVIVHLVKGGPSGWMVLSINVAKAGVMDAASADALVRQTQATGPNAVAAGAPQATLAPGAAAPQGAPASPAPPGYPSPELSSVAPPPGLSGAAPAPSSSVLGAQASTGDGSPDMIPGAKVAGICMSLLEAQRLPIEGVECLQPLMATPGQAVRCVVRAYGGRVGMTATLRSYDASASRPALACAVDANPMPR